MDGLSACFLFGIGQGRVREWGHLKCPAYHAFTKIPETFKMKSTSIGSPVQLWTSLGTVSGLAKVDAIVHLVEHFLDQRIRHLASCGWNLQKERDYPTTSLRDILKAGFSGRAGFSTPIPWPLCTCRSVRDGTYLQKFVQKSSETMSMKIRSEWAIETIASSHHRWYMTVEVNGWVTQKPWKTHWKQWCMGWITFYGYGWMTKNHRKPIESTGLEAKNHEMLVVTSKISISA